MIKPINIIDLFAGPGGLGEGFSSLRKDGHPAFKIRMSVEKEESAHQTLTLRALYRELHGNRSKRLYHDYVAGELSRQDLLERLPEEWRQANEETLGQPTTLGPDNEKIHKKLRQMKTRHHGEPWIVIGGPPCQAYSLVGRARNKGIEGYKAENDHRHFLYQEYLEVLNIVQPDVFVMENVKGILTAKVGDERLFPKIRRDLEHPAVAVTGRHTTAGKRYKIYSFVETPDSHTLFASEYSSDTSFIIRAELFGIPQTRHRVILLGVSEEISTEPMQLQRSPVVLIEEVLSGLPTLRSKLSKGKDSPESWTSEILQQAEKVLKDSKLPKALRCVAEAMVEVARNLKANAPTVGRRYRPTAISEGKRTAALEQWLMEDKPKAVLNHESRGHIPSDLGRYLFSSCWSEMFGAGDNPFPKSFDYPRVLRPNHANWESGKFADRFRVQVKGRPATTITSHISKDGHYFIHFDPRQCRSLTVREAARIQTFPDNYFFEGNRTEQYVQVGNAVPPYLANQIARIVTKLLGV
ncbi:MAG TPA: DNA (cytosine-5-)-methyltransferase [Candidatus Acidoferrum sp.]|nr:DNA (cytosine-5-)-methyltransferase [Candidatus Acidoferrum sp.]